MLDIRGAVGGTSCASPFSTTASPPTAAIFPANANLFTLHLARTTLRPPGTSQILNQRRKCFIRQTRGTIVCASPNSQPPPPPPQGSRGGLRLLEWTGGILPQSQLVKTAKFGWKTIWLTFMRELAPQSNNGAYTRPSYTFQSKIGDAEFPAQAHRYVLYLGGPCPWCHRVVMALALSGLDTSIKVIRAIDDPERASRGGWVFDSPEPVFGARDLREVYDACVPGGYRGRCTAPLLVDTIAKKAVCNESSIIVQNLNEISLSSNADSRIDLRPPHLIKDIDTWNEKVLHSVNNGVYRCGFATTQEAYNTAESELFAALEELDAVLASKRFVCGDYFTEADLRLFPTAVRFDAVYSTIFKTSRRRWRDFIHLDAWLRDCAQLPLPAGGVLMDTVDIDDCRRSYHVNLFPLNPSGIVPGGPSAADLGLDRPAGRGSQAAEDVYWRK